MAASRNVTKVTSGGVEGASREASQTPLTAPPTNSIKDALALLTGRGAAMSEDVTAGGAAVLDAPPPEQEVEEEQREEAALELGDQENIAENGDPNDAPPPPGPENKNGEVDPDAWKAFVKSEKDKERIATYERNIKEFDEQIKSLGKRISGLTDMVEGMDAKAPRKKTFETELQDAKDKLAKAKDNRKAKLDSLNSIKTAAKNKMTAATDKEQKAAQDKLDKEAQSALAKREEYHVIPLTPEQKERRDKLEATVRGEIDQSRKHSMNAARAIHTIYKERLWVDTLGGMAGYVENAFGIKKSQLYRDIGYVEQWGELQSIFAREVRYLDAAGKPEVVKLDPDKLPETKDHLLALQKYGNAENQAKVWEAVALECEANQVPATGRIIKKIGDEMVGSGEIAVGLDAQLERTTAQINAERAKAGGQNKISPLNFNIFENIAEWGGHAFAARSVKDGNGTKWFYPRVDGVNLQANGDELRFSTLLACIKSLEEEAKRIVTDQWNEEAGNSTEEEPGTDVPPVATAETAKNGDVPTPVAAPVGRTGKAGKAKVTAQPVNVWYVGMDKDTPDPFDYDVAKRGEPNTVVTGYNAIVGPFESESKAKDYAVLIKEGKVKPPAPVEAAPAAA